MTLLGAAVVPSAPLLVPEIAGVSAAVDGALRGLVLQTIVELLESSGDVVVVSAASRTGWYEGVWDWRGFGVDLYGGVGEALPLGLGLGDMWLSQLDPDRPRHFFGVRQDEGASACLALGRDLAAARDCVLLVVGDGSACRTEKAPGYLDPRAAAFDDDVESALRAGCPDQLAAVDGELAQTLLAAGAPAWHVLAGASHAASWTATVPYAEAPYGVGYFVASWAREAPGSNGA